MAADSMDVEVAIATRRAKRVLSSRPIGADVVEQLRTAAKLAPSCFNNQPWRYVFVDSNDALASVRNALSDTNAWATRAPLIIAVASRPEDDCQIYTREYHHFDVGLSVGQVLLQATALGLIAHPIAGYSPKMVAAALGVPDDYLVIALIICAYPGGDDSLLTDTQREREPTRPERKPDAAVFFSNRWPTDDDDDTTTTDEG